MLLKDDCAIILFLIQYLYNIKLKWRIIIDNLKKNITEVCMQVFTKNYDFILPSLVDILNDYIILWLMIKFFLFFFYWFQSIGLIVSKHFSIIFFLSFQINVNVWKGKKRLILISDKIYTLFWFTYLKILLDEKIYCKPLN